METRFIKTLWGVAGSPAEIIARSASAGYHGLEGGPDWGLANRQALADAGLEFVAQIFPDTVDGLKAGLDAAAAAGAVLVGAQAGKDWWPEATVMSFWDGVSRAVEGYPLPVCFETHRGKQLYDPKSTVAVISAFPNLQILADFSHWTCVCESMLHDQEAHLEAVIPRVGYVHARVGHEEGPQVPDPRAPEWQGAVERFEGWWDQIRAAFLDRGEAVFRVDPEFGPPNYLWSRPVTREPLADLWDVCAWMKDRLASRWQG